jgi:hypothetical protein
MISFGSYKFSEILSSESYILLHEAIKTFPEIPTFASDLERIRQSDIHKILSSEDLTDALKAVL